MTDLDFLQEPVPQSERRHGLSLGSLVLIAGILAVAAVVGLQLSRVQQSDLTRGSAPNFSAVSFDGERYALEDLRGQIVVLNFWASWCAPCRVEAPILQTIWETYRDEGVLVLGVAWSDTESDSLAFIDEFGLTYPSAPDIGTRIADAYFIRAVPETFIIDGDGNIVERLIGSTHITIENLSSILDRTLAANS